MTTLAVTLVVSLTTWPVVTVDASTPPMATEAAASVAPGRGYLNETPLNDYGIDEPWVGEPTVHLTTRGYFAVENDTGTVHSREVRRTSRSWATVNGGRPVVASTTSGTGDFLASAAHARRDNADVVELSTVTLGATSRNTSVVTWPNLAKTDRVSMAAAADNIWIVAHRVTSDATDGPIWLIRSRNRGVTWDSPVDLRAQLTVAGDDLGIQMDADSSTLAVTLTSTSVTGPRRGELIWSDDGGSTWDSLGSPWGGANPPTTSGHVPAVAVAGQQVRTAWTERTAEGPLKVASATAELGSTWAATTVVPGSSASSRETPVALWRLENRWAVQSAGMSLLVLDGSGSWYQPMLPAFQEACSADYCSYFPSAAYGSNIAYGPYSVVFVDRTPPRISIVEGSATPVPYQSTVTMEATDDGYVADSRCTKDGRRHPRDSLVHCSAYVDFERPRWHTLGMTTVDLAGNTASRSHRWWPGTDRTAYKWGKVPKRFSYSHGRLTWKWRITPGPTTAARQRVRIVRFGRDGRARHSVRAVKLGRRSHTLWLKPGETACVRPEFVSTTGSAVTIRRSCTTTPYDDRTLTGSDLRRIRGNQYANRTGTALKPGMEARTARSTRSRRLSRWQIRLHSPTGRGMGVTLVRDGHELTGSSYDVGGWDHHQVHSGPRQRGALTLVANLPIVIDQYWVSPNIR